ncbi:DUF6680 family protein [Bradyrhizobium guangdongense]
MRTLFFDLLHTIAQATGVTIDRHELDRLAYVPYGWQTEQDTLEALRKATLSVMEGHRPLFIVAAPPQNQPQQQPSSPYPPPPPA